MIRKILLPGLLLLAALGLGWWAIRQAPAAPPTPVPFEAPPAAGAAGDCTFNWATDPLPELTDQVQTAMQEVQRGAEARAEAFGETCTYADGHADFLTMQTDFNVTLQAADVDDPAELGGLIRRSMDMLLTRFPPDQTPGPQPGRVSFRFISPADEKHLPVQIAEYQGLAPDLSDSELFKALFPQ